MRFYSRLLVAGAASTITFGPAAYAQQSDSDEGLETIMVTSQKRSEDIQKVPLTVTAFEEKKLNQLTIDTPEDLTKLVPGFSLETVVGQSTPFIHGLGLLSSGPWQESLASTFIDGVYYVNPGIGGVVLNNISRIEVAKGPQGTLFGRNAVAGVISYVTKEPEQTPHGDFQLGYGNYGTTIGSLYYTTGITDNLAANIAITGTDQSQGWGRNLFTGEDANTSYDYSARSKWVLTLSDSTKFTLIGDYGRSDPQTSYIAVRGVYPFITTGVVHVGSYYDTYTATDSYRDAIQYGVSLKAEHDFGWADFLSISAYRKDLTNRNGPYPLNYPFLPDTPSVGQVAGLKVDARARVFDDSETQEFQLLSPSSSTIKWVAGAFLMWADGGLDYSNNNQIVIPTGLRNQNTHTGQKTQSYSGFAQATAPLFWNTRLTAGIRYTSDHRSVYGYSEQNTVANQNVYKVIPGTTAADNPVPEHTWAKPTYKLALEHDITDEILGYASFSTGFESAYYSISSSAGVRPLEPVTVDAYEVGVKADLFNRLVRVNAALFRSNLDNVVVTHVLDGRQVTTNAASSVVQGVDLDLAVRPMQNLTITAAMEYLDPHFTSFPGALVYTPAANGLYALIPADGKGQQLQDSEKFSASATAAYEIPSSIGDFTLVGELSHHSGMHYDTQDLNTLPSYTLVNASVGLTLPNDQWDFKLWGKNLSNEKYGTIFPGTGVMQYNPKAPRTYGIRVGYHW